MKRTLFTLLILMMVAGLTSYSFNSFASGPPETDGDPAEDAKTELNTQDETLDLDDIDKKRRRKKRRKSSGRRGQNKAFDEGVKIVSIGYGTPNWRNLIYSVEYSTKTGYEKSGFGPFHVKFEYGLGRKIGLGLHVNTVQSQVRWQNSYTKLDPFGELVTTNFEEGFDFFALAVIIKFNYHFYSNEKIDIYGGFGLGYNYAKEEYYTDAENDPLEILGDLVPADFESTVGMKYFFTDIIGAYIELGYAKSIIQGGISAKF